MWSSTLKVSEYRCLKYTYLNKYNSPQTLTTINASCFARQMLSWSYKHIHITCFDIKWCLGRVNLTLNTCAPLKFGIKTSNNHFFFFDVNPSPSPFPLGIQIAQSIIFSTYNNSIWVEWVDELNNLNGLMIFKKKTIMVNLMRLIMYIGSF